MSDRFMNLQTELASVQQQAFRFFQDTVRLNAAQLTPRATRGAWRKKCKRFDQLVSRQRILSTKTIRIRAAF